MKFKKFKFPTFEEWYKNNCQCKLKLGCFYASISIIFGYASDGVFMGAISTSTEPLNFYAERYGYVPSIEWKTSYGMTSLRDWYNTATKSLNDQFEKYLTEEFIESEV